MRLCIVFLVLYLIFGTFLWMFYTLPEAKKLSSHRSAESAELSPAPPPAQVQLKNTPWVAPLGLLVLDISGSMESADPHFLQTLATDVYGYFFSELARQECSAVDLEKASLGAIFFSMPGNGNDALIQTFGKRNWISLSEGGGYAQSHRQHLETFLRKCAILTGQPGKDDPRQGGTPYGAAARRSAEVLNEFRAENPGADVYCLFFTDGTNGRAEVRQELKQFETDPRFHFEYVEVNVGGITGEFIIDRFLSGLQLVRKDVTGDFGAIGGYRFRERPQLQPLVLLSGSRDAAVPVLVGDTGREFPMRGRNGVFYVVVDPADPEWQAAQSLTVKGGLAAGESVHLYTRSAWSLRVTPHELSILDAGAAPPRVIVEFSGSGSTLPSTEVSIVEIPRGAGIDTPGRPVAKATLAPAGGNWEGEIDRSTFQQAFDYVAVWSGASIPLRYRIEIMQDFDVRFLDTRTGRTGVAFDGWTTLPQP